MPLQPGTRLGPYEIVAAAGVGGMGEVYKAADTRLNRTVAIKVLPPQVTGDVERKHRFEREAQVIASLNHPNICTLYDIGKENDLDFLVMEFLEGETLADRLRHGAMTLDESLKVGTAVADALEKAHGKGVTHRDLKPANIMLTSAGAKLLDFGLAKLQPPAEAVRPASNPAPSPPGALVTTIPGMVMGTPQYMAPEQLEGSEADARTDIFAFGVVLYEMLTGRRAFQGKSQPHLIASILSVDPEPVSKSQPAAPPALDFLVNRCLAKDPEQRLQTATDLLCELRWIAEGGTQVGVLAPIAAGRGRRTRQVQLAAGAITLLVASASAFVLLTGRPGAEAREDTRFLINVPEMPDPVAASISPNGRWIAFSARDGSSTALFVRPVGSEVAKILPGTDGAGRMFWSADSEWIAFFANGKLRKVPAEGGPAQNICETIDLAGGSWNAEGTIVFASTKGFYRVLAAGGDPSSIEAASDLGPRIRREPFFLPDGRHYLYLAEAPDGSDAAIWAASLDSTGVTRLVSARSNPAYAEGRLLYHRDGTLYAQPFSPGALKLSGDPIRVSDRVASTGTGAAAFAVSQTGILLYRSSPQLQAPSGGGVAAGAVPSVPLLWFERASKVDEAGGPAPWAGVDVSPDGKRIAVHRHDGNGGDIWVFDERSSTPARFTFDATQDNAMPIWSPDAARIAFGSRRNGKWGVYVKRADNTGAEERVFESDRPAMPMSWSGDRLVYWTTGPTTSGDIWSVSLTGGSGERKPEPVLQTSADERNPQVSPDGKWMAYSSNETGRSEIYIRPFPQGPGKIQVSVNGGVFPRWRHDGKRVYFLNLVSMGSMMSSDVTVTGASIQRDVPVLRLQSFFLMAPHNAGQYHAYAVSPKSERFLIPQFESVAATFAGRGVNAVAAAVSTALPTVIADRRGTLESAAAIPITVVVGWTAALSK